MPWVPVLPPDTDGTLLPSPIVTTATWVCPQCHTHYEVLRDHVCRRDGSTADEIALDNLVLNPSLETDAQRWNHETGLFTGTQGRDNTRAKFGTWSYKVDVTDLGTPGFRCGTDQWSSNPPARPIQALTQYTGSVWVWSTAGGTFGLMIAYGAGGVELGNATTNTVVPAGTWTRIVHTSMSPATAQAAEVRVITASGDTAWYDGAQLYAGPPRP